MRISYHSLMLSLLLGSFMISANPLNSLSRRGRTSLFERNRMNIICGEKVYPALDLETAAKEVCTRIREEAHCRDAVSCYYIKMTIPAIPSVDYYTGDLFPEYKDGGPLLKWPLPKRGFFEKTLHYAIVYKNSKTNICKTIGAIARTAKKNYIRCTEKEFQNGEGHGVFNSFIEQGSPFYTRRPKLLSA